MATLADPTDYGNAPGQGPLRPGGVTYTELPLAEGDLPNKKSPRMAEQDEATTLVRDLWGGQSKMRARATAYLPRAPGEYPDDYRNRLARSAFFNAFRRTIEGLTGLVFRKDPVLANDVPAAIVKDWENIDNAGTHGDVFCRDLLEEALTVGHTAVLVDFPKTDGTQDARAEMSGQVRPYWVPIKKDDIMSARTAVIDGKTVLAQLVLRECQYVADGAFSEIEQERYRVLFRVDGGLVGWQLLEITSARKVVVVDFGFYPTQDEIPVAEIVSSGKEGMFQSTPPLEDLAHLNVAHYQMWSDYQWSIHKTCVPFIFGAGIQNAIDEHGNKVEFLVGANSSVLQPNADATMQYVSHSGESLGSVKAAQDDLKNDMGSLGLAMLAPQKRTAETAEAKRLDKATTDSSLSVTARGLQDGLERALGFHARYYGEQSGGSIEINRDYEGILMDAPVMQAFASLVQAGFPPMAVLVALQQGGRIAADADLDALEMEWLMGQAAKQAMADAIGGPQGGPDGGPDGDGEPQDAAVDEAA